MNSTSTTETVTVRDNTFSLTMRECVAQGKVFGLTDARRAVQSMAEAAPYESVEAGILYRVVDALKEMEEAQINEHEVLQSLWLGSFLKR